MEFVLSLKALWHRRLYVAPGLVLAFLLALVAVFRVSISFPPDLKSREQRIWVASSQVLIDSSTSAIGDLHEGLGVLIPRAGVYANMMTSPALVDVIGHDAGIPGDEISVAGPIGTNGQRPTLGATAVAPGGAKYTLQLNTDQTQPIIRITATAPTSHVALALANGASAGLASYVTQVESTQMVPYNHRVKISALGQATESPGDTGLAPLFFLPLFIVLSIAWCMLTLFVSRFRKSWRIAPDDEFAGVTPAPLLGDGAFPAWSSPTPATFDFDLHRGPFELEHDCTPGGLELEPTTSPLKQDEVQPATADDAEQPPTASDKIDAIFRRLLPDID